jgi:hypothetical protein
MEHIKRYWLGALAVLLTSGYAGITFILDLPGRIATASAGFKWIYDHQNGLTPLVLLGVIVFVLIREKSNRKHRDAYEERIREIRSDLAQIHQKLEIAEDEAFALSVLSYLSEEEQTIVAELAAYAVRWSKFNERVNNGDFLDPKSEGQFKSAARAGYQPYDTIKRLASARLKFDMDNVDIGHIGAPYSPQSKLANEKMLKDYQDEWLRNARREIRTKALMEWISSMKKRASNIISDCAGAALADERYTKTEWRGVVSVRGRVSWNKYHENQGLAAIEALKNLE